MTISIIHGSDNVASRNKVRQLISKYEPMSVVRASGAEITDDFLVNNLRGGDLFSTEKVVVLEDPDSEVEWSKFPEAPGVELILLFSKELPATSKILKDESLKKAKVFLFEKPPDQSIFKWLDLVAEKNPKAYQMMEELAQEQGEQYLTTMLFYLLRRQVLPGKSKSPSMQSKLEKQRRNFPIQRVEELYRVVIEYDAKSKRGEIEPRNALFLIVEKFIS